MAESKILPASIWQNVRSYHPPTFVLPFLRRPPQSIVDQKCAKAHRIERAISFSCHRLCAAFIHEFQGQWRFLSKQEPANFAHLNVNGFRVELQGVWRMGVEAPRSQIPFPKSSPSLASRVLPVPGGPTKRPPAQGLAVHKAPAIA